MTVRTDGLRRIVELECGGTEVSRREKQLMTGTPWRDMGAIREDWIRIESMRVTKSVGLPYVTAPKTFRHTLNDKAVAPVPVWAFHGEKDNLVPVAENEHTIDAVRNAGGNARLTVLPAKGHHICQFVCDRADL